MSSSADSPRLGSLAQSARKKHLNQVRGLLIVIGLLTIVVNVIQLVMVRDLIKKAIADEIEKQGVVVVNEAERQRVEDEAVRIATTVCYALIAVGVLYLFFAAIVHQFPVPVTIISLVIYVGAAVIFAVLDPQSIAQGIIFKIIIIVLLVKAIQTAIAYEQERKAAERERDLELEPEYE